MVWYSRLRCDLIECWGFDGAFNGLKWFGVKVLANSLLWWSMVLYGLVCDL